MLECLGLRRAAIAVFTLGCSTASTADTAKEDAFSDALLRPYFGASGALGWANDEQDAREGAGLKLSIGWMLSERWSAELMVSHLEFDARTDGGVDSRRTALGLEAVYAFSPSAWTPLVFVGAGAVHGAAAPDQRSNGDFTVNGGLGLMTPPFNKHGMRMRFEARYVHDEGNERSKGVHAYLGVTFPLRRSKLVELVAVETNTVVEEPVTFEAVPRERNDAFDSPACCASVSPEVRADVDDREQVYALELPAVYFDFDSTDLTASTTSILRQVVQALRAREAITIEVAGHTDSIGSATYNFELSLRRAQRVIDFLVAQGVEWSRLVAVGYGESQPIADNTTSKGRASNRRVEFRILSR